MRFDLLRRLREEALEWIFPSNIYCICCGAMIDPDMPYSLCEKCMADIHWINGRTCERCGKALGDNFRGRRCYNCMAREHEFGVGISCMTYGLKERQMILDYKYSGKSYMGRKFGDMMVDRLAAWKGANGALSVDVIVPVPIHPAREKKRGFNQSGIMAGRLSSLTGIPVRHRACKRVKNTKLLRSMSPVEREAALEGAFEIPQNERPYVDGMRVLLVEML